MAAAGMALRMDWAVLGSDGGVLVIFGGQDAHAAANEWGRRGYRIVPMGQPA